MTNLSSLQMVRLMVSVLIPCHVKIQILFAPAASVSAAVASEILAETVLKVNLSV